MYALQIHQDKTRCTFTNTAVRKTVSTFPTRVFFFRDPQLLAFGNILHDARQAWKVRSTAHSREKGMYVKNFVFGL